MDEKLPESTSGRPYPSVDDEVVHDERYKSVEREVAEDSFFGGALLVGALIAGGALAASIEHYSAAKAEVATRDVNRSRIAEIEKILKPQIDEVAAKEGVSKEGAFLLLQSKAMGKWSMDALQSLNDDKPHTFDEVHDRLVSKFDKDKAEILLHFKVESK